MLPSYESIKYIHSVLSTYTHAKCMGVCIIRPSGAQLAIGMPTVAITPRNRLNKNVRTSACGRKCSRAGQSYKGGVGCTSPMKRFR